MAKAADWFERLSKEAQAKYLKEHPNSKYAKGAKTIRYMTPQQALIRQRQKERASQDAEDRKFKKLHPNAINTGDESPVQEAKNNIVYAKFQLKQAKEKLAKAKSAPAKERAKAEVEAAKKELEICNSDLVRAKARAKR